VAAVTCSSSTCSVSICNPGYYDFDKVCTNGCECQGSAVATCALPTGVTLSGPGTGATVSGNLIAGTETWYTATFTGNTAAGYHPFVTFTSNPNGEYVFDIFTSCTGGQGALACGLETGSLPTGVTAWETQYAPSGGLTPNPNSPGFMAIPALPAVLIHVYRAAGAPVDCAPYTLGINN
jgi:hypothetical protein